ncbi:MAG: cysteine desulfurase [Candidatus Coatesbacteria bacterium]|nr:MAG: cysteine desulfurase [Candidatus Coatesbacteria bacterium]
MNEVYLDNNATTVCDPAVVEEMSPFFTEKGYNPSSIHRLGQAVGREVAKRREQVAGLLGASSPDEIVFTAGGSEADNLAVIGAAYNYRDRGRHVITTPVEHPAVLEPCDWLAEEGWDVTYLPVDETATVNAGDLEAAIRDDTVLVSVMHANNEVGTVEPITELGRICRERGVLFHTDAVQSIGKLPVNVGQLNADMLAIAAHKFYGPKGVGALYVRSGVELEPIIHGGHQEGGRRAGTTDAAGIVGLAKALEMAVNGQEREADHLGKLRKRLVKAVNEDMPEAIIVGHPENVLPGTVNVCFPGLDGEAILLALDAEGFAVSTGSACSSGSPEPSHVHLAMGIKPEVARGSIRISMGRYNTEEEIERLVRILPAIVRRLLEVSPLAGK